MSDNALLEKPGTETRGGKYLTFALGREEYGLEILKVREIFGYMDITAVPNTPAYVRGVINLRGRVISVVDLRTRFAMPPVERTEQTCIIVVEIQSDGRRVSMGIVVDRVLEVLNISAANIEDSPNFGAHIDTSFILGMGKIDGTVKILLDIDRVLSHQELTCVAAIGNTTSN
jgi:purine-binding chemotaxis protein CheW